MSFFESFFDFFFDFFDFFFESFFDDAPPLPTAFFFDFFDPVPFPEPFLLFDDASVVDVFFFGFFFDAFPTAISPPAPPSVVFLPPAAIVFPSGFGAGADPSGLTARRVQMMRNRRITSFRQSPDPSVTLFARLRGVSRNRAPT